MIPVPAPDALILRGMPPARALPSAASVGSTAVKPGATRWEIAGPSPQLHNEPGLTPDLIRAVEQKVTFADKLQSAPDSVELYRLEID